MWSINGKIVIFRKEMQKMTQSPNIGGVVKGCTPANQLIGWLIDWLIDRSINWLVDWLIDLTWLCQAQYSSCYLISVLLFSSIILLASGNFSWSLHSPFTVLFWTAGWLSSWSILILFMTSSTMSSSVISFS